MIRKIINRILGYLNIGVKEDHSSIYRSKIQISNSFFFFPIPLMIANLLVNFYTIAINGLSAGIAGVFAIIAWGFFLILIPIAHYKAWHNWAFVYSVMLPTIMSDILYLIFGLDLVIAPIYLISVLTTIFFFEKSKIRSSFILFIMINYALVHLYLTYYQPILVDVEVTVGPYIYFVFATIATAAITMKVLSENKRQLLEANHLLKELEDKNQELERFAFITSHDLKEPLRSIAGFSALIQRRLDTSNDDILKEYLQFIKNSTFQLNELIDSISRYTLVSKNNVILKDVSLNDVIQEVERNLLGIIVDKSVQIQCSKLPRVKGEKKMLVALFQNLIENGIKYNKSSYPRIKIDVEFAKNGYVFSVKDNGIGINAKYFDQVFESFRKLHSKVEFEGSGVGLSVCRKIVQLHKGEIWLESTENEGSTFYFSIGTGIMEHCPN